MAPTGLSDLPTEALDEIARRVGPFDNVTCSAVCRAWRRALKTARLGGLRRPGLPQRAALEPRYDYLWDAKSKHEKKFWIKTIRVDSVHTALDYNDGLARPTAILGCSHGWMVILDDAFGLSLLDPLTGRRFPLPPIASSRTQSKKLLKDIDLMGQDMFQKAAVVPGRRLGTYAVMLIHSAGHGLLFLAPGAKSWTVLRAPTWAPKDYLDAVFHKGVFYTISIDSQLNAWVPDGSATGLRARLMADPRTEKVWAVLVESLTRDELLMVSTTNLKGCLNQLLPLWKVSRYDKHEGKWIPATDHGDMSILVGERSSFCVPRLVSSISPTMAAQRRHWDIRYSIEQFYGCWFLQYVAPQFSHY